MVSTKFGALSDMATHYSHICNALNIYIHAFYITYMHFTLYTCFYVCTQRSGKLPILANSSKSSA